jgi:hypothetical protein
MTARIILSLKIFINLRNYFSMKAPTLLCLFVLITATSQAQDARKWFLGYSFSSDLCYRRLSNGSGDPAIDGMIAARNKSEHLKMGFTTGLNVKYQFNDVISVETGLMYSNKGYKSRTDNIIFGDQVDPGQTPSSGGQFRVRYNYKYLDLPLKINIVFAREETYSFYLTAGAVVNVFLEQKNVSTFTSPNHPKQVTISGGELFRTNNSLNISPFIGPGIRFGLGKRLHMQVEPLFRYGVLPLYDAPIKGYLWNWGLNTVLYYAL